jgi:septal ring factor EnvC (AmiA/AmiB activator)
MGMEENVDSKLKSKRALEEEHAPLWIKLFGGSMLSVTFLSVVTLTGYIVNSINSIQMQVNMVNVDMMSKKEFYDQQKNIQSLIEKYEQKIVEQSKSVELISKEIATHKERMNGLDAQLNQLREENKQIQKDLQYLRERFAAVEGKFTEAKK